MLGLLLAGVGRHPDAIWVVGAIALGDRPGLGVAGHRHRRLRRRGAARTEEQGAAVGARIALYRAAMVVSGGAAITLAGRFGWPAVNVLLALVYVPMLVLTWKAPEPEEPTAAPKTLRDAVWHPVPRASSRGIARSRSSRSCCSTSSPTSSRRR